MWAQKSDCLSSKPCSATYQLSDLGKLNNPWISVSSTSNSDDSDVYLNSCIKLDTTHKMLRIVSG